ncbi:MAG TPA: thiol reductant ABC exporter subunit CydD [Nocardioidaceae bacterium]|nr:thiol reductant ABC exporter subunit CydD [Nocardioidaceae bacterium]
MRPSDPRVRAQLAPARTALVGVVAGASAAALLVIAQAFCLAGFLVAAVQGERLAGWALALVGVLAARALAGLLTDVSAAVAAARVGQDMRGRVLAACLDGGSPRMSSGEAAVLVTRGVAAAEPYLTRYIPALVLAGILPVLTVIALLTQDVIAGLIVLATLPLVPVFGALVGLATRDRAQEQWRFLAVLSGHFLDVMKGLPTLVAFRRARAQSATIRAVTERYRLATGRTLRIAFASSAVLELVATLSVALVAVVVGVRLAAGGLDLRTALVVLLLAPEAYWPLRRVGAEFHAAAEGLVTFERLAELSAAPPETPVPGPWAGDLVLTDTTVRYPDRDRPAVAHVSTRIPARGLTAVVGPSGSGKSTLLAAAMGLLPVADGTVQVGGRDIGGVSWQSQISWLPQRPTFVAGTVADNLRLGTPDATDTELWRALERVGLAQRVRNLPDGLESLLGEDGRTLSAGERARLALARAVVAGRPWLFLDEPTAHLDERTEQVVAATLVELARTTAVVVVAHRQALVDIAQHVVELPAADDVEPVRSARDVAPSLPAAPTVPVPAVRSRFVGSVVLGALASTSGVALTATAGWLIVKASEHPAVLTMLVAIVGVRAFGLARPVLRYAERLRSHDEALRLLAERRVQVYDAIVPLVPGRLGRRRGDALAAIVEDVDAVVDRRLRVSLPVRSGLLVVGGVVAATSTVLPAAGALIGLASLLALGIAYGVPRVGAAARERRALESRAELSGHVVETLQSAPELVMWQAEGRAVAAVQASAAELAAATVRGARLVALGRAGALLVTAAGVVGVGTVAADAVAAGRLSAPMLALLTLVPVALLEVVLPLADAGGLSQRVRAAEERLESLEATEPLVVDGVDLLPEIAPSRLAVTDVSAGWGTPILKGLSLELAPGSRVGVTGPSGSGKSTLAALLLRFIDPVDGSVEIDGAPLPTLVLDEVRARIGLVDDDPHVFATTLAENVRFARPGASDSDIEEALRRAGLGPWLDGLPDGLDTWLGDGHGDLSGGERARLAVARSLLADQPVLVLDEPTAALDSHTAERVARDVLDVAHGRSVVWITHSRVGLDRMDTVLQLG